MQKVIIGIILVILLPSITSADYDRFKFKAEIDRAKKMFQVESWKESDDGTGWVGTSKIRGVTLFVNKKATAMLAGLGTNEEIISGITNCMKLGEIGLKPETEYEKIKINDAVFSATKKQDSDFSFYLNNVIFAARSMLFKIGGDNGAVALLCNLKPAI